jgi:4-hydroxy-2-oxoheptanedioate aldolase
MTLLAGIVVAQGQRRQRLNPMIELLEQKKPVFGLYMPANPRAGRGRGAATAQETSAVVRTPAELGKQAVGFKQTDLLFSGSMPEYFAEFQKGMMEAGSLLKTPFLRLTHPVIFKIHKIADDPQAAWQEAVDQLNMGTIGHMLVEVESAEEVQKGLAAARFKSKGGTRPDAVGNAPAVWGMTEAQYKQKADLWPLNPEGELVNWTIIESKPGLEKTREIAAVKGIGVLWPGAGTLGGVFSTTGADGRRVRDDAAWEAAIQKVLAACKEFNIACGYPANSRDIEMRMKQGFSVFLMGWGEDGFKAIETGRRVSGRETSN